MGLHFSIEEIFLDDKSNGFELERSHTRDAQILERLCFVLAFTTLYLAAQGLAIVEARVQDQVDVHWLHGNSFFRIGWDGIRHALIKPRHLIDQKPSSVSQATDQIDRPHLTYRISLFYIAIEAD